jgi:hypothetical protein
MPQVGKTIEKSVDSIVGKKLLGKMSPMGLAGIGLNAYFTLDAYKQGREEGIGRTGAMAKAIGESVMMDAMGIIPYGLMQGAKALPKAAVKVFEETSKMARSMSYASRNIPFQNATFVDTPQASTMRQAGMQLAKASKYNLQQTMLGNEAQYLHL